MTGASVHSPDRTSVPPKADVRMATAVSPAAIATTNSVVAASLRGAIALAGVSSLDLPAASSGVDGLSTVKLADRSDCIGDIDPNLEAAITALEVSWLRCGILMNAATLATIAASESFSNSTSSVGA